MKLPRWVVPWRKADQNAVTPISTTYQSPSRFGWILESFGGSWQRGLVLASTENILAFSAVYACIGLIAGDVAKLRVRLMKQAADGIWDEVTEQSPFWPVLRKPNRYQTWTQFIGYWVASKLQHGNAYIVKERDARGVVRALYPLDPRAVHPLVAPDGDVFYQLARDALAGFPSGAPAIPASEIIHDRMNTLWHPLCGVSPIYACGTSATQGIRIQGNSEAFFRNMSRPSGQLTAPGTIDNETAARLKREFEEGYGGDKLGRLFVSGSGLKYESIPPIPAQEAQLIEQLKWTAEDVARAFGVPLYKISAGDYPNLTSIGAINQDYHNQVLHIHIRSIEQLLDEGLGLPGNMKTDIDEGDMLRMDPVSRAEIADKRVKGGVWSPNEARAEDNLHPVAGGATPYLQEQNYSLAALAKRDAKEDPFAKGEAKAPAAPEPETDPEEEAAKMVSALISKFATAAPRVPA